MTIKQQFKFGAMSNSIKLFVLLIACILLLSCSKEKHTARILVFSKTAGYRHASIPYGIKALQKLTREHGVLMDTTENAANFNEENLKKYNLVIFLNTTGDVLNQEQQNDFERFIQAGGGFAGVHAATDTEYGWPWYGRLVGAYFQNHPRNPNILKGVYHIVDHNHPSTDSLPDSWEREDEFYNFRYINPDIKPLIKIDERSYKGGTKGENHPVSWYHEYDGGRAFYTNMGHTGQSYSEPLFLKHLWGGITYALGGKEMRALDYSKAHTLRIPVENRFSFSVLAQKLNEPMELEVLDDNKVIIIERKGAIKLLYPETGELRTIARIPVSTTYNPQNGERKEAEDGLLGIALDPEYGKNHWIYLYYSPAGADPKNILTRYEFKGDSLLTSTRKVMLEVPVQRDECCHTGGSIVFDSHHNLYLSTGDNTSPRATGYSPIDERPGRAPWDAQKSSSNTNDLRGKIIRIHPEPDGTYSIPEGNLFPRGMEKTKPEIYIMGTRNPFRISLDKRTGFLYWGDVGPDAMKKDSAKGPAGMDELNQARKAGFFGWPYFVGNNQPYNKFDFEKEASGPLFEVAHPENNSPNNTGTRRLPPAQGALIWYPYDTSPEFPLLGTGGRTCMAGPVFYSADFKNAAHPFPDYYNGKLFMYEWMRGLIFSITLDKEGNYVQMERFLPNHKFTTPIDLAFGKDGSLYVLEYGTGWFQGNDDARLLKIEYNGANRKPKVEVQADKTTGATPLTVNFSSRGTYDFDKDRLKYQWRIINEMGQQEASFAHENIRYTFQKPGIYKATLTVTDEKNESASKEIEIQAGNSAPVVEIDLLDGNRSFYFPGTTIHYEVQVSDPEDGSLKDGQIAPEQVVVTIDRLEEGYDQAQVRQGHQTADASVGFIKGKNLIDGSDCRSCHAEDKKSVGPAFRAIAEKYKSDTRAEENLASKVISGGSGIWGQVSMPAHPQLSRQDAVEMIRYILSRNPEKKKNTLPPSGTYAFNLPAGTGLPPAYLIRASYRDKGIGTVPSLTREKELLLKCPKIAAALADLSEGIQKLKPEGSDEEMTLAIGSGSYLGFSQLDLSGIGQIAFTTGTAKRKYFGGKIEVRLDKPAGQLIGESGEITFPEGNKPQVIRIAIRQTEGIHALYFIFKNPDTPPGKVLMATKTIEFISLRSKKRM